MVAIISEFRPVYVEVGRLGRLRPPHFLATYYYYEYISTAVHVFKQSDYDYMYVPLGGGRAWYMSSPTPHPPLGLPTMIFLPTENAKLCFNFFPV